MVIFKFKISLMNSHSHYEPQPHKRSYATGLKEYQLCITSAAMNWPRQSEAWLLYHMTVQLTTLCSETLVTNH